MKKFLIPRFKFNDLPMMLVVTLLGALIAGAYGILHDQLTYSISEEYFTKLKFNQFKFANFGFPDEVFVVEIGFLATWWVGLICGWFLSRRFVPEQTRPMAWRQIGIGIGTIFAFGFLAGCLGWIYGIWRGPDADYSAWAYVLALYDIDHTYSFIRVAYIHNASYAGALVGLIVALFLQRPKPNSETSCRLESRMSTGFQ